MVTGLTQKEYIERIATFQHVVVVVDGKINQNLSRVPQVVEAIDSNSVKAKKLLKTGFFKNELNDEGGAELGGGIYLSCQSGEDGGVLRVCHIHSDDFRKKKIHNIYRLEPNARLSIVEEFWASGKQTTQYTSRWIMGCDSKLKKYTLGNFGSKSRESIFFNEDLVTQYKNSVSSFYSFYLPLGRFSAIGKHENIFKNTLLEDNASCEMKSVSFIFDENAVNNVILMTHEGKGCHSSQVYRGIYGGNSRGVFDSCVVVKKDAQETKTQQKSDNLLLSDRASINTNPKLEIFADNVECAHGATTGQLDENALFYLASRGVGEKSAQNILLSAFIGDIIENIPDGDVQKEVMQSLSLLNTDPNFL